MPPHESTHGPAPIVLQRQPSTASQHRHCVPTNLPPTPESTPAQSQQSSQSTYNRRQERSVTRLTVPENSRRFDPPERSPNHLCCHDRTVAPPPTGDISRGSLWVDTLLQWAQTIVAVGALVFMGILAWRTYELARWTAYKDYRETCARSQMVSFMTLVL